MRKSQKFLWTVSVAFMLLAVLELSWLHGLKPFENRLSDLFVRQQAQGLKPDSDIVIVDIDDPSIAHMQGEVGRWPWPRSVHGEMVSGIVKQSPKAIVFDLTFTEPDADRLESDQLFNEALNVKMPIYFPMVRKERKFDAVGASAKKFANSLGLLRTAQAQDDARIAIFPPLAISEQHWHTGTINFLADSDGVGRRYFLYQPAYGWLIPSLPARVAADLGYVPPMQEDMILAWRGFDHSFQHISYFELYEDFNREKPLRPKNELTGKIVIIGTSATDMYDLRVTPIASEYPGVEILATAIDNLKNHRMMREVPAWMPTTFGLMLLLSLSAMFLRRMQLFKIGGFLLAVSVLALWVSYATVARLYLVPVLASLVLAGSYYFVCALRLYLDERRKQEEAVNMFSRFVNPHVVKEMIAKGGLSQVGESRQISVLFSDIRGFTTLSENRTPQEIVDLLNRYFTLQVAVVFRHGGSLDKFIGDCIMAFWGAPLDDPNHAQNAVAAAMEMAEALQAFKIELGEQDKDFDVGIGVHSGAAVVGLIGPQQKLEYTAIGDTVNLASRIESLTKGVSRILVSGETKALCGDTLDFTAFGSYKVKGREQEVELFAPKKRGTQ